MIVKPIKELQLDHFENHFKILIKKRNASLTSFTPEQLSAIKGGRAQIPGFTWHHHQDFSRMQLVPTEEYHKRTGHVGGEYMSKQ
ncbi:HNH endonuclease [Methanosarcina barkeri]|uniref:HNH endonuclease n=1 Tax=Methanosarcina barkeri TaxID=2208 RepID=UPI00373FD857